MSCRSEPTAAIELRTGTSPDAQQAFVPQTALAEYLELPNLRSELRLTLASYEVPCDRYLPPKPGQIHVSVVAVTPAGTRPSAGTYVWAGTEGHGGTASKPERPFAQPKALLGNGKGHLFQPGGALRLTDVALGRHGHITGVLAFEFAGNAQYEATALAGSFHAKICKTNLPPAP